ncbi:MAG: SCO family protein [Flavobacteriales bacterium]|nr:SCO family protein [Flavobacteriales bacterium]
MKQKIKKWILLFVILAFPYFIYNYISKGNNNFVKLAIIGEKGHKIPTFSFINQNNDTITNAIYENQIYIANFIFTSCPTICPTMTMNMRYIQSKLKIYPNIKFLSHSVNPDFDTPERLKLYAKKMRIDESNFNFVTGNKKEIYDIAMDYFVNVSEDSLAPGGFLHSEYLVIIDKQGRVRSGYSNFVCSNCGNTSKYSPQSCSSCGKEKTFVGNPVGSYDGTQDFVIKDLIKDVKTLLAEYHEDAKVERHVK